MISFQDDKYGLLFREVRFLFTAHLATELTTDSGIDDEDNVSTTLHKLAMIEESHIEGDWRLIKWVGIGAKRAISIKEIKEVVGVMQCNKSEYLTTRYTSIL